MPDFPSRPPLRRPADLIRPWRLAWAGWAATAGLLLLGVPLFLRMTPWCDLTLYDLAARNVTAGGVHYRDIFDTNLPGFVWLLIGIRRAFGPGVEVVRAVDLVVVAAEVALLGAIARRAGADRAAVAWMAAAVALFYPFTSEFNHCQRDVWMLLPALAATLHRLNRIDRARASRPTWWFFRGGVVEGAVWGLGVWLKPHVMIPAAAVWLASYRRLTAAAARPGAAARADWVGNVVGGGAVGLAGVGWLVATGTWPHFVDVLTAWNPYYMQGTFWETGLRARDHLYYFPPWTLLQPAAWVLAARDLIRMSNGGKPGASFGGTGFQACAGEAQAWKPVPPNQTARFVLSALFLAWLIQGFVIQRRFHYVHVPITFLMLAVFAARRWVVVPGVALYLAAAGGLVAWHEGYAPAASPLDRVAAYWPGVWSYLPRHPLTMPDRMGRWAECWRPGLPDRAYRERMDAVALDAGTFPSITAVEIGEVAAALRELGAGEGDFITWHDSPHAVYLELGVRPRFRFMHLSPFLQGENWNPASPFFRVKAEAKTAAAGVKYVVTDLKRVFMSAPDAVFPRWRGAGPDLLPPVLGPWARCTFPYDQPAVFRSDGGRGRYVVHRLEKPILLTEYDVDVWVGVK